MEIELTYQQIILFSIIAVIIGLTVLIILAKIIKRYLRARSVDEDIKAGWQKIERLISSRDEQSLKLAVLEADKLLDQALKIKMFPGRTLGEKLKVACYKFLELRRVWPAHVIRNKIVHEADFNPSYKQVEWAIRRYKQALEILGTI